MKNPFKRLIPKPPFGRADFINYASLSGWVFEEEVEEDRPGVVPYELIYGRPGGTWLHYVDDLLMEMPYIVISGRNVDRAAVEIQQELPIYEKKEVLRAANPTGDHRKTARAVRQLAIMAPPIFDSSYFEGIKAGLDHPHAAVRIAAMRATTYPGWPEFMPLLERIRVADSDPRVRADAEIVLDVFKNPPKE